MWNRDRRQSWFSMLVSPYQGPRPGGITSLPNRVLSVNSVSKPPPSYYLCSTDCQIETNARHFQGRYVEMWGWQPFRGCSCMRSLWPSLGKGLLLDRPPSCRASNMIFLGISYMNVLYTTNSPTAGVIMRETWWQSHPPPYDPKWPQ